MTRLSIRRRYRSIVAAATITLVGAGAAVLIAPVAAHAGTTGMQKCQAHQPPALVKVIIEAALLNEEEKIAASLLAKESGADYVKTSTGFASGGATVADVQLMRRTVGPRMGVKAAGGVRTRDEADAMVQAGATRIGASAGVKIVQSEPTPAAAKPAADAPKPGNY